MTTQQLEEITRPLEQRIATLESELHQIKQIIQPPKPESHSILGSFADCPEFDAMEKAGKAWRTTQNQAPDIE